QKMSLWAVAEALGDAGLAGAPGRTDGRAFDRDRCAVIMGNAMGGEFEDLTSLRVWFTEVRHTLEQVALRQQLDAATLERLVRTLETEFLAKLPKITEDSMPGELSNCITGRIANAFDLRGPNFTTDAACAASMAAVQAAARGLSNFEFDVALAGGADRSMDPPTYVKFSKIGALSPSISAPFDARADGFVMGEGVGILVLRRLEDALAQGERVYAVIRGIGASSDGRGKGMTAPNPRGQRLAVERAYEEAGFALSTVGLIEAHGTSTTVGDNTELQVLTEVLKQCGAAPRQIPVGSVKSMIGHLKSAAGAAAIIKSALALHHKVLPPSANFVAPPAASPLHQGYLQVNTQTRPWAEHPGAPRRAGVSAFGFGGTNFHVVLEEFIAAAPSAAPGPRSVGVPKDEVSKPNVRERVVALIAQSTGYSAAELQPELGLEADLGIDTVKQAEIMAALRQAFGLAPDSALSLAQLPTLQAIVDYVEGASAGTPGPEVYVFGGVHPLLDLVVARVVDQEQLERPAFDAAAEQQRHARGHPRGIQRRLELGTGRHHRFADELRRLEHAGHMLDLAGPLVGCAPGQALVEHA
ncbi:MAG: hypothetical protein EOO40_05075, partial [Deltaproteobacteria bacterium]